MNVTLVTFSYDSGVRGVRMGAGPARLLAAGLPEFLAGFAGDVAMVDVAPEQAGVPSELSTAFGGLRVVSREVAGAVAEGRVPVVLAGSCYATVGVVAGLAPRQVAVVWFDSHGDLNTPETTTSGFLDGMAACILTGRCFGGLAAGVTGFLPLPDERLLFVGVRDLDPPEARLMAEAGLANVEPGHVRTALGPALDRLRERADAVHVHLDLDVLDPEEARANALAAPGGLSASDLVRALEEIRSRFPVVSMALTAYDPAVDPEGRVCGVAMEAVEAAFGG